MEFCELRSRDQSTVRNGNRKLFFIKRKKKKRHTYRFSSRTAGPVTEQKNEDRRGAENKKEKRFTGNRVIDRRMAKE